MLDHDLLALYAEDIKGERLTEQAKEHGYRPALKRMMDSFTDTIAVNDPKRSSHGNPDFVFLKRTNTNIILGYAETKDIDIDLDKEEKTDQMHRYGGYEKLFLTNYLEFRFFRNGVKYKTISIGKLSDSKLVFQSGNFPALHGELASFLELPPERIKSGVRLAQIMGAKARRIRDNVSLYLNEDNEKNLELYKIYKMMKQLLVHDLSYAKFADMYAQTLVYGLFVARYGDASTDNFTRNEARDLVPASNPFLREFFDHIVGPHFDSRLGYIVDELCEIFSVSDVKEIVHRHLRLTDTTTDGKDPIIHFYEDFLNAYDPKERKRMGAYYTPVPVVRFIVRNIDKILMNDFDLPAGISDTSKKTVKITTQGSSYNVSMHKVQILDPAVGTATFLNEIIKYIYDKFKTDGQEGRWSSYVESDLLPRLYGFELMMAPYTIAHLKLGITLSETGISSFKERIGVYLTNTLEEGIKDQIDLFTQFGLAEVISKEADEASIIKSERPIMVITGNPPYSISSSNKSSFILNLIKDYKFGLGERKINLDDDYIKFLRFSEATIEKNGEGIIAMITNNSFIDGVTHRQMRKHLLQTFDDIYILNLHGNSKKNEVSPQGEKDENIFDIQLGVSINIFVKRSKRKARLANVYYSEVYGRRIKKFEYLNENLVEWEKIDYQSPSYYFVPKDFSLQPTYDTFIPIKDIFIKSSAGIKTKVDHLAVDLTKANLVRRIEDIIINRLDIAQIKEKYGLNENTTWEYEPGSITKFEGRRILEYEYRPFDIRYIYFDDKFLSRSRREVMDNFYYHNNLGLELSRVGDYIFVGDHISDEHYISDNSFRFPLYLYHDDGTRSSNISQASLKKLSHNLKMAPTNEDIIYYIYGYLNDVTFRATYAEFLKVDFPRIPIPENDQKFKSVTERGEQLVNLHLMKSPSLETFTTTYSISGTNIVDKIEYKEGSVWINSAQSFGGISESAWNYYIGSYQPAQKWLKERKGHELSSNDIEYYQKIIKILEETQRLTHENSLSPI